jgi:4-amino-4-deoxy-L-arabinose transferase-like glycosyltransferase
MKPDPNQIKFTFYSKFWQKWGLIILLISATLLFSADIFSFSLRSIDDCFYARKGIEMGRSGNFFTVTWNHHPTFQLPPLQFWILGRSFSLFGESDFAARIPFILMALGILLGTYRIVCLTVGKNCALVSMALLIVTPLFYENAQRCMLEVPLAFWVTMAMLIFMEGLKNSRWNLFLAIPLAAAILTKSVLGLLPLILIFGGGLYSPSLRRSWSSGRFWGGIILGIILGSSWTIHQGLTIGIEALRSHYVGEIFNRSTKGSLTISRYLTNYLFDSSLWGSFQPMIIPAVVSLVQSVKNRLKGKTSEMDILIVWVTLPIFLYSLSLASTDRYIFPIMVPVAILAGYFISRFLPRIMAPLFYIIPAFCLSMALLFWVFPQFVAGNSRGFLRFPDNANQVFKDKKIIIQSYYPENNSISYLGEDRDKYWDAANPFLYYWEIYLQPYEGSLADAILKAQSKGSGFLVCNKDKFDAVKRSGVPFKKVAEGKTWLWLLFLENHPKI